jgi:cohesin complex subunit SCC1
MFYSEQLLAQTGPLARVWMAANVERKLTKSNALSVDIPKSINTIIDTRNEPIALRFSSQLMLGVVRIYGKKAKYLQDDCHEALLKIRMTFRNAGNLDLPANATTGLDLNLPDMLTIDDLFPSMDFAYPLTQGVAATQSFDPDWTSTLQPPATQSRLEPDDALANDDLGLDFGDDYDVTANNTAISVQHGRNTTVDRDLKDEMMLDDAIAEDDLGLDLGEAVPIGGDGPIIDDDINMDMDAPAHEPLPDDEAALRARASSSPLSEADPEVLQDLDATFAQPADDTVSEIQIQQRQRSKKIKPLVPDTETVLHNRQIKAQSEDRSKILKAPSFLPRNNTLLTLMNLQANNGFVDAILNDGQSKNWAPELQGLLSFDVVVRGQKRKRDSGIAMEDSPHSEKSPRLELDDEEDEGLGLGEARDDDGVVPITDEPALENMVMGEDEEGIFADEGVDFDETTIPLLHPADSGPVSVGTKRAVHLLREKLGGSSEGSPKKSVLLQELVPEKKTSKEDATKMFFEVLVLATKDAVKVEQAGGIGGSLWIRGKRGLWGSWADEDVEDVEGEEGIAA